MNKADFDKLAKSLTTADPKQLAHLRTIINGLDSLGGTPQGASQAAVSDDWLWSGIVEELVSRGLLSSRAAVSLQQTKAFKSYQTKAEGVREVLLKAAPGLDRQKVVLQAFGRQVAACLMDSLSEWTVVTPSLVLSKVDTIPSAVDECFPGYIASGLLSKLVKVARKEA